MPITFKSKFEGVEITNSQKETVNLLSRKHISLVKDDKKDQVNIYGLGRNNNSFLTGVGVADLDTSLSIGTLDELMAYLENMVTPTALVGAAGVNPEIDNLEFSTLWEYGATHRHPNRPTTGVTMVVSSDDATDINRPVVIKFGTKGDGTHGTETVMLNGQNKVTFSGTWLSAGFVEIQGPGLAGNVYIYEDTAISGGVPTDTTKVMHYLPVGVQKVAPGLITIPTDKKLAVYLLDLSNDSSNPVEYNMEVNVIGQSYGWIKQVRTIVNWSSQQVMPMSPTVLKSGLQYRFTAKSSSGTGILSCANAAMIEFDA